jgi:hypothetical protein
MQYRTATQLFATADACVYTLPADILDVRTIGDRVRSELGKLTPPPSDSEVFATALNDTLTAARAGAVLTDQPARRVVENAAAVQLHQRHSELLSHAVDQAEGAAVAMLQDRADEIIVDHLRPAPPARRDPHRRYRYRRARPGHH